MVAVDGSEISLPVALSVILGITMAWLECLSVGGAPMMLDPKDIGVANGVQNAVRSTFSSLASKWENQILEEAKTHTCQGSIYITILNNRVATNLKEYVGKAIIAAGLPVSSVPAFLEAYTTGNTAALVKVPGVTPDIIQAAATNTPKAFYLSFQMVYYVGLAFALFALMCSFLLDHQRIQEKMTSAIPRRLQGTEKGNLSVDAEAVSSADALKQRV